MFLIVSILECNKFVFHEAMFTYTFYYKTIHMGLGFLAHTIVSDWYKSFFVSTGMKWVIIVDIWNVVTNMGVIVLVTVLFDGYFENKKIKLFFATVPIAMYSLFMIDAYLTVSDKTLTIYGYSIYWRTIAISSLSNVIIFTTKQMLTVAFKADNVLTVVNCYIPLRYNDCDINSQFLYKNLNGAQSVKHHLDHHDMNQQKSAVNCYSLQSDQMENNMNNNSIVSSISTVNNININRSSSLKINLNTSGDSCDSNVDVRDEKINSQSSADDVGADADLEMTLGDSIAIATQANQFSISLLKKLTLLYIFINGIKSICSYARCLQKCVCCINSSSGRINAYICSDNAVVIGSSFTCVTIIAIDGFATNYVCGWTRLLLQCIYTISLTLIVLNINYEMFRYQITNNFLIWWRLYDAIIVYTCMTIIDINYNDQYWNKNNYYKYQSILITIFGFISVVVTTLAASMSRSYLVSKMLRWGLVVFIILFWSYWGLKYFTNVTKDVLVKPFGTIYTLSMRSTVIYKTVDLVAWFTVELVSLMRYSDKFMVKNVHSKWIE